MHDVMTSFFFFVLLFKISHLSFLHNYLPDQPAVVIAKT